MSHPKSDDRQKKVAEFLSTIQLHNEDKKIIELLKGNYLSFYYKIHIIWCCSIAVYHMLFYFMKAITFIIGSNSRPGKGFKGFG